MKRVNATLPEDQHTFMITRRSVLLTITNVSDKNCRKNQNTCFNFYTLFFKSYSSWDNVEKYCTAGQVIDNNMAHSQPMLDT